MDASRVATRAAAWANQSVDDGPLVHFGNPWWRKPVPGGGQWQSTDRRRM